MAELRTTVLGGEYKLLDARLANPRYVNYPYPAPSPRTLSEWKEHAKWVRLRILVAAGLLPEPERTPLNARIYDSTELDGCTVEKVYFEGRPGLLMTGNLYRPVASKKKHPAILCPHGHWKYGRVDTGDDGGVPARCVMLARLGFVVFSYDMVGYNDSCQIEHRWSEEVLRRTFLYGVGTFGLQLWNSIRAIDFVAGLPDVDPKRIGCTGTSGGSTQTYYLSAVDQRIKAAVPVCMLSSHYQGGCSCEGAPLLHLNDLSTIDVVAAMAPRPVLLLSVTQDWSNQNPTYEVPAVRKIYELYGAGDRLDHVHFDAPHNYNRNSREHMYAWFKRRLMNDTRVGRRIREPKLKLPTPEQTRLFPDRKPPARFKQNQRFINHLTRQAKQTFAKLPKSSNELNKLRATWTHVYAEVLGAKEPEEVVDVGTYKSLGKSAGFTVTGRTIGRHGAGEGTPALWITPAGAKRNSPAALFVNGEGKSKLFSRGRPKALSSALIGAGVKVLAIDMLGKGETAALLAHQPLDRRDPLFYAYNPSLTAHRVQEILTALAALRQHDGIKRPSLIGIGAGAVLALLARPLAGPLRSTVVDLQGCKLTDEKFWMGEFYHPFILKLGGLNAALALGPLSPLIIAGADAKFARWARATYRLKGRQALLRVSANAPAPASVAKWVAR